MSAKARPVALSPKAKPLKRPTQGRAKVTVQAMFDAFVRIWQRDGWSRLTTRAVALEAGVAVGTLYDYFPSKAALLSGYVRYCMERLMDVADERVVQPESLSWVERLQRLMPLLCGVEREGLAWVHPDMLLLEPQVAEDKHQRRVHDELLALWWRTLEACPDLPRRPDAATVEALHLAVWGGRRYAMLVGLEPEALATWSHEMFRLSCLALAPSETP